MTYKRILVAVDGNPTSERALREAINLAKDQQAELRLVHVVDDSVLFRYGAPATNIDSYPGCLAPGRSGHLESGASSGSRGGARGDGRVTRNLWTACRRGDCRRRYELACRSAGHGDARSSRPPASAPGQRGRGSGPQSARPRAPHTWCVRGPRPTGSSCVTLPLGGVRIALGVSARTGICLRCLVDLRDIPQEREGPFALRQEDLTTDAVAN